MSWTLAEAKRHAKKYELQVAVCIICEQPHIWQIGQYLKAPETCGRDACEVQRHETLEDGKGIN